MDGLLALGIYKIIIGTVGILGNGLVCLVIGKVSYMQTRTNAFIFHQAVIDFIGSIINILQVVFQVPDRLPDNFEGWFWCKIWKNNVASFFFFITSTYNLLILTLERYFAIVHPFKYQAAFVRRPRLKVGVAFCMCWILAAAVNSYGLIHFENRNGTCVSFSGSDIGGIMVVVAVYVVPVGVMLFAYIRTSAELKRGAARVGPSTGQAEGMSESLLRARRNTFKTLLIVFITFLVCWTPNEVYILMFSFGYPLQFTEWYYIMTVVMVATNSCVNPVIYVFKYRQFRKGLRELMCSKCSPGDTSGVSSVIETTQSRPE